MVSSPAWEERQCVEFRGRKKTARGRSLGHGAGAQAGPVDKEEVEGRGILAIMMDSTRMIITRLLHVSVHACRVTRGGGIFLSVQHSNRVQEQDSVRSELLVG